jgi:uncharacterized protein
VALIDDPQKLNQPTQGGHPEGTDVSALDHNLGAGFEQLLAAGKVLRLTSRAS